MKFEKKNQNLHLAKKKKKQYTLMLIPHKEGSAKSFHISFTPAVFASGALLMSLIFLTFFSVYFFQEYQSTRQSLEITEADLEQMHVENHQQKEEIAALESYAKDVEVEVSALAELQREVLDLVELDSEMTASLETLKAPVSRSNSLADMRQPSGISGGMQQGGEDLLTPLIEQQKTKMTTLIPELEDQIEYLDAKPNILPTEGRISSPFGERNDPFTKRISHHNGIDIANNYNTPIYAAGSGVVIFSGYQGSYGRVVIISHGYGYKSIYAHNQENLVSEGDRVEKQDPIAKMGSSGRSTGPHVHFEVHENGTPINPKSIQKEEN